MHNYLYKGIMLMNLALLTFSCVPNKKIIYLQGDGVDGYNDPTIQYATRYAEYILKKDDVIGVNVFSTTEDELNFFTTRGGGESTRGLEFTINEDGEVELPVVGFVKVAGLNIAESQNVIKEALSKGFLENPVVQVTLLSFNFTVLGEVNGEGTFTAPTPKISVLEALSMAGGLQKYADRSNIKIVRNENDKLNVHTIDVLNDDFLSSDFYYLKTKDVIIVSPLKSRNFQEGRSSLAFVISIVNLVAVMAIAVNNLSK
ncbi:polysaccharide biosynthesis/export family protein [Rapidithrix thailandica]|uniref:Polysaccharide biosynthesis/export family protein n=1 Tax=Rapidithrix thailandica TaxID=413964 RepID=A0AAW9SGE2_9BACT